MIGEQPPVPTAGAVHDDHPLERRALLRRQEDPAQRGAHLVVLVGGDDALDPGGRRAVPARRTGRHGRVHGDVLDSEAIQHLPCGRVGLGVTGAPQQDGDRAVLSERQEQPGAGRRELLGEVDDDVLDRGGLPRARRRDVVECGRHEVGLVVPARSEASGDLPIDADHLPGSSVALAEPGELGIAQVTELAVDAAQRLHGRRLVRHRREQAGVLGQGRPECGGQHR